jgi:hypothetical protein
MQKGSRRLYQQNNLQKTVQGKRHIQKSALEKGLFGRWGRDFAGSEVSTHRSFKKAIRILPLPWKVSRA